MPDRVAVFPPPDRRPSPQEMCREIFGQPARGPEGFFHTDVDLPYDRDFIALAALWLWLLDAPGERLARYSDQQVGWGFCYLLDLASGDAPFMFADTWFAHSPDREMVDEPKRLQIIRSMGSLYRDVFCPRLPDAPLDQPHMTRLDKAPTYCPLNYISFMLWDVWPIGNAPVGSPLEAALIALYTSMLQIPHGVAQMAALHGIKHTLAMPSATGIAARNVRIRALLRQAAPRKWAWPAIAAYADTINNDLAL